MIKGAIIFALTFNPPKKIQAEMPEEKDEGKISLDLASWKVVYTYMYESKEKPSMDTLTELVEQLHSMKYPKYANLRKSPEKFTFQLLDESETKKRYILYILSDHQSLEILDLAPVVPYEELISRINKKTKVNDALNLIVNSKNDLLEKIQDKAILQKQIGNKANALIDKGDYTDAQDLMKIAQDIPSKFIDAMEAASSAIKEDKFRAAEKNLQTACDLAVKLEEPVIADYLKLRIETIQAIPTYHKQIKKNLKQINGNLNNFPDYLDYLINLPTLHKSIDLFEKLEQDDQIDQINKLIRLLKEADDIVKDLTDTDEDIRNILEKLNI